MPLFSVQSVADELADDVHSGCAATSDGCQLDDAYPAHSADAAEEVLISDDDDDTNEDHDANTAQDMPIAITFRVFRLFRLSASEPSNCFHCDPRVPSVPSPFSQGRSPG